MIAQEWLTPDFGWVTFVNLAVTFLLIWVIRREHKATIEILRSVVSKLEQRARYDPLTGGLTATAFEVEGESAHARARRYGGGYVLVLDLDNFKDINDIQGHAAGDRALRSIAAAIQTRLRESDEFGRIGGDEFAVLIPGSEIKEVKGAAGGIREAIEHAPPPTVMASIGVAPLSPFASFTEALQAADTAMYKAKKEGGNRVRIHRGQDFTTDVL